ncbi:MAG: PaaI family thioesterase [Proteobacteria bacterium]|nr:PaaI family thioesterase [Pseudomonadota bacterium]
MTDDVLIPEGYKQLAGVSPAEDDIGPFYYKKTKSGLQMGFIAQHKNCNGLGTVHGGVLMCFADYAATMLALSGVRENCATISFTSDFMAGAKRGDWVEASGVVVKRTGSLTFLRGQLTVKDELVLSFQAVMRRLKKPA